jgi:hypothetical protein
MSSSSPKGLLLPSKDVDEDRASTIRQVSFDFSDHGGSDEEHEDHVGDYSTRMDELFDEGEGDLDARDEEEGKEDEGEDGFLYTGVDAANVSTGYRDQLRDVLGQELTDDEVDAHEVEKFLVIGDANDTIDFENGASVSSYSKWYVRASFLNSVLSM